MPGSVRIVGWGESPPNPGELVTNDEVLRNLAEAGVDIRGKTGKDTEELTGIKSRWLSKLTATEHADRALLNAIRQASLQTSFAFNGTELELIYGGSSSPDFVYPACGCENQGLILPQKKIEALDISLACTSFVAAVCSAKSRMKDKGFRYGAVAVGEQIGERSNAKKSLNNCLWGTGGGAVVLNWDPEGDSNYGIIDDQIVSDGQFAHWTRSLKLGCHPCHSEYEQIDASMEGHEADIHRYGLRVVSDEIGRMLRANEDALNPGAPVWLLSHNANWKMQLGIGERLGIPERYVLSCIADRGNTSSASIAITLARYADLGYFKSGDLLLLAGFGGGMSMGLILYRWPYD